MKLLYLVSTIFALSLSSCQSDSKTLLEHEDYSISYEKEYLVNGSGTHGTEFYITLSHDDSKKFTNNINLLIQELTKADIDLQKFVNITESQINSQGKLISSERITRKGTEYQSIIFEANFGEGDLRFLQYNFIQNDKAYILTYAATIGTFDKDLSKAKEVMDSFKLNPAGKL